MDNPVTLHMYLLFLTELLDRVHLLPLHFPFLLGHLRKNMLRPSSTNQFFDVQDRQSLPLSSAPFEEYAAAARSLERSF